MVPFVDNPNRTLLHDVRVWISGIEVTPRLTSSVSVSLSGRGGHNTASFSLSNASNGFILTAENLEGVWRDGDIGRGEHSEHIKRQIHQYKASETLNPINEATGTRRWPLAAGAPVLHALDPVFVAVRDPYSPFERWIPRFLGYINGKPVNDDWIQGKSTIQISCYDIRALMAYMRVQMNYLITNEVANVSAEGTAQVSNATARLNAFDPVIVDGIISDLQIPTNLTTPLAKRTFEETIRLLIVGGLVPTHNVDPSNGGEAASPTFVERLFRFFGVGGAAVAPDEPAPADAPDVLAGASTTEDGEAVDVKAIGRFSEDLGPLRWPAGTGQGSDDIGTLEQWHRLVLYGIINQGFPWTNAQVTLFASETAWDGAHAPHAGQLYMLLPSEGSGMGPLTEYTFDSGSQTRTWSSRKTIIEDYLEKLDFQWFVNGCGDICVEFPTYDMDPEQWGEWSEAFTVRHDGEGKSINFEDDRPEIPTIVQATGAYDPDAGGEESDLFADRLLRGDGMSLTNTRVTLYAPVMAGLLGARVERVSYPFVTDTCRLRQFATLYFQRRMAEASSMGVQFIYRPLLTPNRPIRVTGRDRLGWISSVTESYSRHPSHGVPNTSVNIQYVRKRGDDGQYNFITGSKDFPLSFNGSGPLMTPARGILITESFTPGENNAEARNSTCPDDQLTAAPDVLGSLAQLRSNNAGNLIAGLGGFAGGGSAEELGECSQDEGKLTGRAKSLWQQLRRLAGDRYNLTLELACTHNPGAPHEGITPYLHDKDPSPAFDINITREDGSAGTADDFAACGVIAEEIGLKWGGSVPETANAIEEAKRLVMERANYHVSKRTPYVYGSNGPSTVDCSGLIVDCYTYAGIFSAGSDYSAGSLRELFPEVKGREPYAGELCFYNSGRNPGASATHVTIFDGSGCISASGPGQSADNADVSEQKGWVVKKQSSPQYRRDFIGYGAVFDVVAAATGTLNHFWAE